jgi:hypothetical protein
LFVNSIIRQIIGDPYFNWEFIYSTWYVKITKNWNITRIKIYL